MYSNLSSSCPAQVLAPPLQRGLYPFFSFSEQRLGDLLEHSAGVRCDTLSAQWENGVEEVEGEGTDEDFIVVHCKTSLDPVDENT